MTIALVPGQAVELMVLSGPPVACEVVEVRGNGDEVLVRDERGKRRLVSRERLLVKMPPQRAQTMTSAPNYELGDTHAVPKDAPSRSERYLAFVRKQSCAGCSAPGPSDPHHWALKGRGRGGMGMKVDDYRVVPLCRKCHDDFHQRGTLEFETVVTTRIRFLAAQTDNLIRWIEHLEGKTR